MTATIRISHTQAAVKMIFDLDGVHGVALFSLSQADSLIHDLMAHRDMLKAGINLQSSVLTDALIASSKRV